MSKLNKAIIWWNSIHTISKENKALDYFKSKPWDLNDDQILFIYTLSHNTELNNNFFLKPWKQLSHQYFNYLRP